ncbi:MAG: hypothetical protein CMP53_06815 [Flavobacteriales bacterium]|nr:hypothetical protein [Flavobacteriales bacterium]|tara:strand:- start:2932 stop:3285 length:354 start_codon:yes stop_codon:yes gene_type:complete
MNRIFYLSTCDTCKRILNSWNTDGMYLQDIKTEPITPAQLDDMINLAGSAEALFSKRARKYKELGLKNRTLSDTDIRQLILSEYTFLKRPVLLLNDQVFAGNSPKVVEAAALAIQES